MLGFDALGTYALGAPPIPSAGQLPIPYYFADRAFTTEPDDDPPNTTWQPRVAQAFNMERTLPLSPLDQRRAQLRVGEVVLVDADAVLDTLMLKLPIDGRKVEVMVGAPGWRMDQFRSHKLFTGTASGWRGDSDGNIYATLKDGSWEFDAPLQTNLYGGTGGADGGPELTGLPKPLWAGPARDIQPVLVDKELQIYQVHDGPVKEITDVSDRGVGYTLVGDVADIWSTTVLPGECKTQLSAGLLRVGTAPLGILTCTGKGDNAYGRYVATTAGIIFRWVHDRLGWPDSRFNLTLFQQMRVLQPAAVGFYTGLTPYTVAQVVDQLCAGTGLWWLIDNYGLLGLGRLTRADAVASRFLDDRHILDVTPIEPPDTINPPFYEVKIGAQRRWTDLAGNFAGGITADRRAFLSQPYRYPAVSRDAGVRVIHPQAQTITLPSLFDDLNDAKAEQDRILADFSQRPRLARIGLKAKGYFMPLGGTVNVNHFRYDLQGGRNCRIYGHGVRSADNSSFIEVWY